MELHLIEFAGFAAGWFAKGMVFGLASTVVFQPLSKRIWRALQRRAHAQTYIAHHLERHPSFNYKDCLSCHLTPTSEYRSNT